MGKKKPRRTKKDERREKMLDEALEQSFPASDPPSMTMPHPSEDDAEGARRSGEG